MPNALTHRTIAAALTGIMVLNKEDRAGKHTLAPLGGSILAAICTNLPDILEPAINPHHRQIFHSFAFAVLIAVGMHKLTQWKPEESADKLVKASLLIIGGAYLTHLALDACTSRSLPLVGKV